MSSSSDQAYLNTRVSVMATRLTPPGRMAELITLDLDELAERVGVAAVFASDASVQVKSRAVEQTLISILLAELQVLVRPMHASERALIHAWGRKYALFNLKTLIRGKLYDLDQREIRDNLYDLSEHLRLPHQELFRAENVLELLRVLERGPHSLIARQAREVYERQREPFALEAAIDQRYFAQLVRQAMQFQDERAHAVRQILGALLDHMSLLWLLRFRFAYDLSPSETFYQLVPSPRLMNRERLLALVELETFEQVLAAVPPPLDALLAESTGLVDVQRRMAGYLAGEARRVLAHGRAGVARALAYLILREMDLFALFALVQGELLQLPKDLVEIALEITEPTCSIPAAA